MATPMCVEVVKSMAEKPTRSITGAMVSVMAVSMPVAPQRLWLPSRSEVSTMRISATWRLPAFALDELTEPVGVDAAGREIITAQHGGLEFEIGAHAIDAGGSQRFTHAGDGCFTRRCVHDDLAQQRVVVRRHHGTGFDPRV